MNNLSKTEVEKIVKDEIKKYIANKLDDDISKLVKSMSSKTRKASVDISKGAINKLAEFLWIRRSIYQNDIK